MIKKILAGAFLGLSLIGLHANADTYVVKQGDTLGEIARVHDTTVDAVASVNGIANPDIIHVGQEIELEAVTAPVSVPVEEKVQTPSPVQEVVTDGNKGVEYAAQRMAQATGVSVEKWRNVIFKESGNRADVVNPTGHFGYFQIAPVHNLQDRSVDGQVNMAIEIYQAQGGQAWEVW